MRAFHPQISAEVDAGLDRQLCAWAEGQVGSLPKRWARELLRTWEADRQDRAQGLKGEALRRANEGLRGVVATLGESPVGLDATDADICEKARELARECVGLMGAFSDVPALRAAMERLCEANGVEPPEAERVTADGEVRGVRDMPAVRRMSCDLWWRRRLRRLHGRCVETAAIRLGRVSRSRECYVSDDSAERRAAQNRRNAEAIENTIARNEDGDEFTLAELCAKGTGSKAIRRAELMTRIAGFERIAVADGHAGLFVTLTCPSRMHKYRTIKGGRVVKNPRYDGTTPREAQAHLSKCWAKCRAALARRGLALYGFRIAEPHHDGCPHWHALFFVPPVELEGQGAVAAVCAELRKYFLIQHDADEPGAESQRCKFVVIDASKGTAAGYIAKYVAKSIDGYAMESDLFGNPALQTSARVEAWAATWGIRQFQQIGGPPVTVWRELRRVAELPDDAPEHLQAAHMACNRVEAGEEVKAAAWDAYCAAQGGIDCGREYRIRIEREARDGVGRYGDPLGMRPVGVRTLAEVVGRDGIIQRRRRLVQVVARSERHEWEIMPARRRRGFGGSSRTAAPWTRVNNCTQGVVTGGEGSMARGKHGIGAGQRQGTKGGAGAGKGGFGANHRVDPHDAGTSAGRNHRAAGG